MTQQLQIHSEEDRDQNGLFHYGKQKTKTKPKQTRPA